jgi:hypothetical protein
MIPSKVLQRLINTEVLTQIIAAAEAKGFKDIAIFKPVMESQANNLHFLATPGRNGLTDFDQASLIRRIKEILQTDNIIVEDEQDYNSEDRGMVIGKICPLYGNSLENIARFCHEELALRPKVDTRFEDNKMISLVEIPEKELSDEEKEQYINAAVNQFATDLRKKVFPSSGNNFTSKLLSA